MIKIYGMDTCPDCTYVKEQVEGNGFDEAKKEGLAGIPCFVLEDGTVTLLPEEAGLRSRPAEQGASCSLDGSGC